MRFLLGGEAGNTLAEANPNTEAVEENNPQNGPQYNNTGGGTMIINYGTGQTNIAGRDMTNNAPGR